MIEIVPYQDRWRAEFAAIGRRLRSALGQAALRIDQAAAAPWAEATHWNPGPSDA